MEGDHVFVAFFRPVVVDEPVFDGPGRIGEKSAPSFLIGQDRLIEGQHGDAQELFCCCYVKGSPNIT